MKTLLDPRCAEHVLARFRKLRPETPPRWGQLTAPRMLTHLSDQLRYTLGEYPVTLRRGVLRWPLIKQAVMYWMPWPKARIKGSPEMFLTSPTTWSADVATFASLVDRVIARTTETGWPEHPAFGALNRTSWGRFCYRHIDYHLRQFGA